MNNVDSFCEVNAANYSSEIHKYEEENMKDIFKLLD